MEYRQVLKALGVAGAAIGFLIVAKSVIVFLIILFFVLFGGYFLGGA